MIFNVAYIENPYRLLRGWYLYGYICIYVEFLASHFSNICRCTYQKFTGWAMIEDLAIRRRPGTFLISRRQKKTRVKYCYVDLSSWYGFWFAIICIDMNVILDFFYRNPTILQTVNRSTRSTFFYWKTTTGNNSNIDVSLLRLKVKCENQM